MMTSAQDVTPVGMPITRPWDVQSEQDEQSGLSGTGTWQLNQKGLPARVVEREIGCEAKITKAENRTDATEELAIPSLFKSSQ